jgi:single-strand DNA-binding protein
MNKVLLCGNLGKAPELRFTPSGKATGRFSVATSERWTDQDGNKQERTEWHNVVVWGKQAEACGQYLDKGSKVLVEGSIRTRKWEQDGVTKWMTEVIAQHVEFLSRSSAAGADSGRPSAPPPGESDEIPF